MSRSAPASGSEPVTATSVLALVRDIERVGTFAPIAITFMMTLIQKGREAYAVGGPEALDALLAAALAEDPDRADAYVRLIRAAWDEVMPSFYGRTQP